MVTYIIGHGNWRPSLHDGSVPTSCHSASAECSGGWGKTALARIRRPWKHSEVHIAEKSGKLLASPPQAALLIPRRARPHSRFSIAQSL